MQADVGTVGVGAPATVAVVVVMVLQNGCVCSYWDDDITLWVWSRLGQIWASGISSSSDKLLDAQRRIGVGMGGNGGGA